MIYFVSSSLWHSLPRPRGGCLQQLPTLGVSRLHHRLRLLTVPPHLREAIHPACGPHPGDGWLCSHWDLRDEEEENRHYEEGRWCCQYFPKVFSKGQWRIRERRLTLYKLVDSYQQRVVHTIIKINKWFNTLNSWIYVN